MIQEVGRQGDLTLDWLERWNLYSPQSIAIQDGETLNAYTYQQLYQYSYQGATYLNNLGIQKGDRIAILSLNSLDYIVLFFALQRLGAILVPINYRLTKHEVQHIINDCQAKMVFFQEEFAPLVENTNKKLFGEFSENMRQNFFAARQFAGLPEDPAMIIYTSGTTGAPKGAVISNRMLFWNSINTSLRLNITQQDSAVIFLPLFHTGGWNVLTTPFLHHGAKIILLKKFEAERILELCESQKTTLLFGVPTTMDLLARSPQFQNRNLNSLRYAVVGGEPMPIELIYKWKEKGIAIRQGYGLTEFGPNVFSLNEEDSIKKIGSIGFPNFYIQVKVMDDGQNPCKADEIGELWLKGPGCMSGYWNNVKSTQETMVDGWLRTGDLVRYDQQGYFYVIGRKKDMYKSGGENVYPAEVEKILRTYKGVRDVAVIGVPDPKWGEVGKAFVVLDENVKVEAQNLINYSREFLAKFKIPQHYQFVSDLPKGESGKILKRKLTE